MSSTTMTTKQSTVDMLKKLALENTKIEFLQKRKLTSLTFSQSSPTKKNKHTKIINDENIEFSAKQLETTTVDLLKAQESEQDRKKAIFAAKFLLQQAEEEDFEENHPMLHEKYKEVYNIENINAKMVEWKQSALNSHQQIVESRNKFAKKRQTKSMFNK